MANVKLRYAAELSTTDPAQHAVLIVGQMRHLLKLSYDKIKVKLEPRVTDDVSKRLKFIKFQSGLDHVHQ